MRGTPPLPEDEPLLAADDEGAVTGVRVYGTRWWSVCQTLGSRNLSKSSLTFVCCHAASRVLFQLSLLTFNQSLFWITL